MINPHIKYEVGFKNDFARSWKRNKGRKNLSCIFLKSDKARLQVNFVRTKNLTFIVSEFPSELPFRFADLWCLSDFLFIFNNHITKLYYFIFEYGII